MKNSKNQRYTRWLTLFALIILLVGCKAQNENALEANSHTSNKTLTVAFPWSPSTLDPHGQDSWEVMRSGTGETLVRLNENLEPTPWLAKEWNQEDETTWVLKLQEHVTFHNGVPMDAEKVKDSLIRSMEKSQRAKDLLLIESIEALTASELKIVTKQPNSALMAHLADPAAMIVDVKSLEAQHPALTGAFKIEEFKKDESLVVSRYEEYWGEPALLSKVTIQFIPNGNTRLMALQAGDVHAATDIPIDQVPLLEKDEKLEVLTAPSLRTHMIVYNLDSPYLQDASLRKILDHLVPRKSIVDSVMNGLGTEANSPFSDVLPFGKVERVQQESSIELIMTANGWKKNRQGVWEKDGKALELTMLTFPQRPELTVMAEVIQDELGKQGVKVHLRQVENIDDALTKEDWDLSMYSMLTAHTGDPQYFLNVFYRSGSESNVSRYTSRTLEEVIEQLNRTTDGTKRAQLAIEAQETINGDLPQSFIVHPVTVFAVQMGVKGFVPHPIEYYYIHAKMDVD